MFLRELSDQGTEWQLKDHWQDDRHAIGLTSAEMPEHLAYVRSWQQPPGEYYVELEFLALGATVETTISDPYPWPRHSFSSGGVAGRRLSDRSGDQRRTRL